MAIVKVAALSQTKDENVFLVRKVWEAEEETLQMQPHYEIVPRVVEAGWYKDRGVFRPPSDSDMFIGEGEPYQAALAMSASRLDVIESRLLLEMVNGYTTEQLLTWHAKLFQAWLVLEQDVTSPLWIGIISTKADNTSMTAAEIATEYRDKAKGFSDMVGHGEAIKQRAADDIAAMDETDPDTPIAIIKRTDRAEAEAEAFAAAIRAAKAAAASQ